MSELDRVRRDKRNLETLGQHPGWKHLHHVLSTMIVSRRQRIFALRPRTMDGLVEMAAEQAELAGLGMLEYLREALMRDYEADAERLVEEEEQNASSN